MNNIVSAIYGANNKYVNVSEIISNSPQICISNDIFEDPIFGIAKKLIIVYKNGTIDIFNENDNIKIIDDIFIKYMPKMKIYAGYNGYSQGGFGDFIRSAFSLYVYCVKNNIDFGIYIPNNPIQLGIECIRKKINVPEIMLTCHQTDRNKIIPELDMLKKLNTDVIVYSNVLFINVLDLFTYRNDFIKNIIKTKIVAERVTEIKNTYIKNNEYVCLHIRCGDKYISTGGHCVGHQTENFDDSDNVFIKIEQCIKFLEKFNLPICVISDNDKFKNILVEKYPVVAFDTIINHVAIPHTGTDSGIIDTISEFFILSESKTNIMFSRSGFVLWSSSIYNVPLYEYTNSNIILYDYNKIETMV